MERTMRAFLLLRLLTVATITLSIGSCNGNLQGVPACRGSEKQALLIFKKHLTDPSNRLSSWVAEQDSDCCRWDGVVCDNSTGHVHELHLANFDPEFHGYASNSSLRGKINPSLLNLTHLTYLNLSGNDFRGTKIPASFGSLKSLTHLDLSLANFGGMVPHQLGNLSRLSHLFLGYSSLRVENLQWVSGLTRLEHLDMSGVNLSKASDHWLRVTNMLPSLVELNMVGCELDRFPLPPFINFTSLAILDLSVNNFDSLIPGWLFSLRSLVSLYLPGCGFIGPIPSNSPHNVTSLREIDLQVNSLNHSIPEWLYTFPNLESLFLHENNLHGEISSSIGNLTSLINLALGSNMLEGKIPNSLGNLSKLMYLDLSENQFTGDSLSDLIQTWAMCGSSAIEQLYLKSCNLSGRLTEQVGSLKNLRVLHLYNNSLSGPIPMSLGNLSCLEELDISNNHFDGSLPDSMGQLKMLTDLEISDNSLQGVVSEAHFTHLRRLKSFIAKGISLTLQTRRHWLPPFQLEYLVLDSWHLAPEFPMWFQRQRQLRMLSLSNTGISGTVPNWFWNSVSQIFYLNLSHNHLCGEIEYMNSTSSPIIDLSSNQFTGSLPLVSPDVIILDLSNSSFSGSATHFFCHKIPHQLLRLYLGNNLLSGEIPNCWKDWHQLEVMHLGNNNLTGNIPSSIGHLVILKSLHLRNNQLSGKFPLAMLKCAKLSVLDVGGNRLVGSLPIWMGKGLLELKVVNLRSNEFQGVIPPEFCSLTHLQILDLADNNLSGAIPRCFCNFTAMVNISNLEPEITSVHFEFDDARFQDNTFLVTKGRAVEYRNILGLVTIIDLSNNKISGEVPDELTNLIGLRYLNLSENLLTGKIPSKIGKMVQLESLDLSKNQLFGEIPASMKRMTSLNHLNVSYNNLTGQIPESTQLQSFDQSSFLGNELCGPPLIKNCSGSKVIPPRLEQQRGYNLLDDKWFYLSLGLGFAVGFWSILGSLLLSLPWSAAFSRFLNRIVLKLYTVIVEYV